MYLNVKKIINIFFRQIWKVCLKFILIGLIYLQTCIISKLHLYSRKRAIKFIELQNVNIVDYIFLILN